ncbi:hypothetical protein G9F72_011790 [Clostridium estertheticum]|uniref:hypothetical protein n=1 Tax=Clostridium estertheticum TaxID=238834 RepID=UPI0013E931F2|nr:hypothetical protein [Clostridium estertheticum]MBZ9687006.1 hypothetical protein [Clostridium estertheticum]
MKKLMRRIKKEIKEKSKKYGTHGTGNLSITLILTDNEIGEFQTVNLDNHYIYDLEENELCINYVEEVSECMNVYVDDLSQVFDLKKLEEENGIFEYNNKQLRLIQDAYLSKLIGHEGEYTALAIDNGGRLYNIVWDIVNFETEDRPQICNWDKYTVKKI